MSWKLVLGSVCILTASLGSILHAGPLDTDESLVVSPQHTRAYWELQLSDTLEANLRQRRALLSTGTSSAEINALAATINSQDVGLSEDHLPPLGMSVAQQIERETMRIQGLALNMASFGITPSQVRMYATKGINLPDKVNKFTIGKPEFLAIVAISDTIVVGEYINNQNYRKNNGKFLSKYLFRLEKVLKGNISSALLSVPTESGTDKRGGIHSSSADPTLSSGEKYLLFLSERRYQQEAVESGGAVIGEDNFLPIRIFRIHPEGWHLVDSLPRPPLIDQPATIFEAEIEIQNFGSYAR